MIRIKIDMSGLAKEFEKAKERLHHEIVSELQRIGEAYINRARENGSYQDRTTNLRNAHSYRVYRDGKNVAESMGTLASEANPTDAMFEELKSGVGYELIVGDGMEYASFVEGKNYDVSESGFMLVERMVNEFNNRKK